MPHPFFLVVQRVLPTAIAAMPLAAQLTWHRCTDRPAPRSAHFAFFDTARGRVTVVGGQLAGGTFADDCWQLEGNDWLRVPGPVVSPRGYGAGCAFGVDSAVLFGGVEAGGLLAAGMYGFDRTALTFPLLVPATTPPLRWITAMVLDRSRQRAVLFGGGNTIGPRDDTWEWDGTAWQQHLPANRPRARANHAMAYDAARGQVVLFGGHDGHLSLQDTWVYDGATWTDVSPTAGPPPTHDAMLADDESRQLVVLFGGKDDTGSVHDATWEWNGSTWTPRVLAVRPTARELASLVYDPLRRRLVLFGGAGQGGTLLDDSWVFDGSAWTELAVVDGGALVVPPARTEAMLVYNAVTNRTTLFGGLVPQGLGWRALTDTWESAGHVWQQRTPVHAPPSSFGGVGTVVRGTGEVVWFPGVDSFGSAFQEAWAWNGTDWNQRPLAGGAISQFRSHSAASLASSANGWVIVRFVAVGSGLSIANTLQIVQPTNGQVMQPVVAGGPSARQAFTLAQLPTTEGSDRVWLYGGSAPTLGGTIYHGDVWELRDTGSGGILAWTQLAPAAGSPVPPARSGAAVTMLPSLVGLSSHGPQLLLAGGTGASGVLNDSWLFDVTTRVWSPAAMPAGFTARSGLAMTFDNQVFGPPIYVFTPYESGYRGSAVAFGGFDGSTVRGEILDYLDTLGWEVRATPTAPLGNGVTMCHDRARAGTLVLDDGYRAMWRYDGSGWQPQVGRGVVPAFWLAPYIGSSYPHRYVVSCFDERAGETMVYAGALSSYGGDTWTDRGSGGPGKRLEAAMVYVPSLQRCIYFGGLDSHPFGFPYGDTWSLDSATNQWTQIATIGPSPRLAHAMACDRLRNRIVLFGGRAGLSTTSTAFGDTWEYDPQANAWQQLSPPHAPPALADIAMTYDDSRARCVLTGPAGTVWEWDGSDWQARSCENPAAPAGPTCAYDAASARTLALTFGPTTMHELYASIDPFGQGNANQPLALHYYSQPARGQTLQLGFPSPQGIGYYAADFGPRQQPQFLLGTPLMCETSNIYASQFLFACPGTAEPNVGCLLPDVPVLVGASLVFQGFALQPAGCFRATDALHVRCR